MNDPTPAQRIAAGYAAHDDTAALAARAAAHRPEDDAEADRLTALGDQVPLSMRLANAFHDSARTAAQHLADDKEKS